MTRSDPWQNLETTALYSNDLRVRAAAIEINLVVNGFDKNDDTVARLLDSAQQDLSHRGWYEWELGMLANRGVAAGKTSSWENRKLMSEMASREVSWGLHSTAG